MPPRFSSKLSLSMRFEGTFSKGPAAKGLVIIKVESDHRQPKRGVTPVTHDRVMQICELQRLQRKF